jgi:tRNA (guanine9-N1)-methyltransferase
LIYLDDAFILGGLIDRSVLKDASLMRAKDLGIESRSLPITQYMRGRICLNLDHVVSMLCKFKETRDWKKAFDYSAPKRWKKEDGKEE